jgi:hypothetical protein
MRRGPGKDATGVRVGPRGRELPHVTQDLLRSNPVIDGQLSGIQHALDNPDQYDDRNLMILLADLRGAINRAIPGRIEQEEALKQLGLYEEGAEGEDPRKTAIRLAQLYQDYIVAPQNQE